MTYYYDYLKKLETVCKNKKIQLQEIGKINLLPIYKIVLNSTGRKVVVFSAGIHGDEIAGPWSIIDFLKQYDFQSYPNIKIIIFPVDSPTAFNERKRYNYLNKELNGLFCRKKLSHENRILFNELKNENVFFFHALHGDIDEYSFYLYNFENKEEKIYRELIILAEKYFSINKSQKIYNDQAINGLIINRQDGSFEDRMFREGAPYSMCTESPEKQPLKTTVSLNVDLMNKVIDFTSRQ
ncbi:MAG: succinylglutamate desuccinylase/aspartoacylase family protein [bacterium]